MIAERVEPELADEMLAQGIDPEIFEALRGIELSRMPQPSGLRITERLWAIPAPAPIELSGGAVRLWGRIICGATGHSEDGRVLMEREVHERRALWRPIDAASLYLAGERRPGVLRAMQITLAAWPGIGRLVRDRLAVNEDADAARDAAIAITEPELMEERLQLAKEAFGEHAITSLEMACYYAVDPAIRSGKILLMEDDGGSGKTSLMHALAEAFPGAVAEGLDLHALSAGGFTAGHALVPIVGAHAALVDEAGGIHQRDFAPLAALSTGAVRSVRFGGGRSEEMRFSLKLLIASNSADSLDRTEEAVARRIVIIPMEHIHGAAWWEEECSLAPEGSEGTRWAAIFSPEGMCALVLAGEREWELAGGEWPQAHARVQSLSEAAQEALGELAAEIELEGGDGSMPAGGSLSEPVPAGEWPRGASPRERRSIRRELKIAGVGTVATHVAGRPMRMIAITDEAKFRRACERYGLLSTKSAPSSMRYHGGVQRFGV